MLDFIYHMTLNIFEIKFCLSEKANDLMILTYIDNVVMVVIS